MAAPPLQQQSAPNRSEPSGWPGPGEESPKSKFDLQAFIRKLFPVTHSDPTGRKAMRALQKNIGWFEPDADVFFRIKSKSRGTIDIRLDFELKSMHMELLERAGEISETQSRQGYRARIKKKNTPTAVVAKQGRSGGSNTETNRKEVQR